MAKNVKLLIFVLTFVAVAQPAKAGDDPAAVLNRAMALQKAGAYTAAINAYREYLRARPQSAEARTNLGAALAHEGRFAEAIQEYQTVVEAEPQNHGVRFSLAVTYYRAGDYTRAAEESQQVHAASGPNTDAALKSAILLADCYRRQGEDKKVIALLDPVVERYPENLVAAYLLGTALLQGDQEERGQRILDQMMTRGDSAEVRLMLAIVKMRGAADLKGALADIERCLELKPDLAEAQVIRGRILLMTVQTEEAEAAFRKAVAADPKNFDALLELGALLRQQDQAGEAVATLKRALELRSGDVPGRFQLALAESAARNDERAVALLEGVIKDTPGFLEAHVRLANLYFKLHKPNEAGREKAIAVRLRLERDQREMDKVKPQQ